MQQQRGAQRGVCEEEGRGRDCAPWGRTAALAARSAPPVPGRSCSSQSPASATGVPHQHTTKLLDAPAPASGYRSGGRPPCFARPVARPTWVCRRCGSRVKKARICCTRCVCACSSWGSLDTSPCGNNKDSSTQDPAHAAPSCSCRAPARARTARRPPAGFENACTARRWLAGGGAQRTLWRACCACQGGKACEGARGGWERSRVACLEALALLAQLEQLVLGQRSHAVGRRVARVVELGVHLAQLQLDLPT